ncbi:tRNA-specific adenosine deaminase TAD3 isoform X2 [Mercurialis annua]|uniref:tRNA-specific adenosine deaminase TAD3 isoform X2 n=1 Tax=Mercurialis annua TaxID=3986 RepID=UPI00215EC7C4|nr:tRNA-specific adenosine deaminase TAD3 isoform X2 [Mercurialis annua]
MNNNADGRKIVCIPDKPPIPPNQQPTVNAFASLIEPKLANALIRNLNKIAPLENFRHVKRIQKRNVEGKSQLSVILCLTSEDDSQSNNIPQDVQELINSYQLSPFITKICKHAATSREEWEEQCKFWPTSFHPPTYNIDGITGFNEEDSHSVFNFMKVAIDLAKSGDGLVVNAAVIVDPSVQQIIASGCDQIFSRHVPTKKSSIENGHFIQPTSVTSSSHSNKVATHISMFPNNADDRSERLELFVSCLNPWQWSRQQLDVTSSCYCHPLRHAPIVAIESSAERDRLMFPGVFHTEEKYLNAELEQTSIAGFPTKRQKTSLANVENGKEFDSHTEDRSMRPYLCTGYDIYTVWEPCTMCAMAMVHQRIRRIFFAFPNPKAGALGSVYRLQGERSLNHHYAVFRVVLPENALNMVEAAEQICDAGRTAASNC